MKTFLAGPCQPGNIYQAVDPAEFNEVAFEAEVVKAICCLFPDYRCGVFRGSFELDEDRRSADLALIHKSLSHWFVIEVELAGHSFERHVLPQVRCFRYGDILSSSITSLCSAFPDLNRRDAESIIKHVPRYVAVVVDRPMPEWVNALRCLDVQLLSVTVFRGNGGQTAHHVEGRLEVARSSLGFARYSATDKSLRISKTCGLLVGQVQMRDPFGVLSLWTVREGDSALWVTKDVGDPLIPHDSYVQVIRTVDGQISMRLS